MGSLKSYTGIEFYFIVDTYKSGDDGPHCTEKPVLHLVVNISVDIRIVFYITLCIGPLLASR